MNYNRIPKDEFYKLPAPELFSGEKEYNRCYATIVINKIMYKFAWESDLIMPVIKILPNMAIVISVDLSFCVIREHDNAILRKSLRTNIFDVFFEGNWCIGICEMNVVVINMADNSMCYKEYSVDDYISEYHIDNNRIIIRTLSNGSLKIIDLHNNK